MTVTRSAERALQHIIPWFLCSMLSACVFKPPPATGPTPPFTSRFENAPLSPVVDSGETKVFEEPGNMVVYHGFACAESNESDGQKVLRIERSRTIPATMNEATVFLNGWHLRYLDGDHKVKLLGTAIFKIQRENSELKWEAGGVIADGNFDDPYRWCYRYTLIAWNRAVYAATRDDRDLHAFYGDNAAGWETALSFHPTYISSADTLLRAQPFCREASASSGWETTTITCSNWPTTSTTARSSSRAASVM